MCTLTSWRRIPPPPEKFGVAASRILVGAPARQPDLVRASRKTDGGAAEGSTVPCMPSEIEPPDAYVYFAPYSLHISLPGK